MNIRSVNITRPTSSLATSNANVNMSNPVLRLSRQKEATWASFHRRVSSIPYDYSKLFPEPVHTFLKHKANSMGSSLGYLVPALITSTSYLLANKDAHLRIANHLQPINLYMMFVGYPGTGKSPAVETVLQSLKNLECISADTLISSTTSSGLIKTLAKQGKAFLASPEVYDVLNKLLKNDEDNASGDVQLLCKLWSGESSAYHFATETTREINSNTPFSILGATQIQNAATVLHRMDKGHGLLDRFLITVPLALKPTPEQEEQSLDYLNNHSAFKDFDRVFAEVEALHSNITRTYTLSDAALQHHKSLKTQHVQEVNEAIKNGEVPPKSKSYDLVARISVPVHVIICCISSLLQGNSVSANDYSEVMSEDIYRRSIQYVEYLHSQKDMFTTFLQSILDNTKEATKHQPTEEQIQKAILEFPGSLVTYQAFKKYAPRSLRSLQKQEFCKHAEQLTQFGQLVGVRIPRSATKVQVFVKKNPADITVWPTQSLCTRDIFSSKFQEPLNSLITPNIQRALADSGLHDMDSI